MLGNHQLIFCIYYVLLFTLFPHSYSFHEIMRTKVTRKPESIPFRPHTGSGGRKNKMES